VNTKFVISLLKVMIMNGLILIMRPDLNFWLIPLLVGMDVKGFIWDEEKEVFEQLLFGYRKALHQW